MPSDRSTWVQFVRNMHCKYRERERAYWEDRIISHAKEPKRLWSTFNALLGRRRVQPECTLGASAFTTEDFLTSHTTKILGIRQATEGSPPPHHPSTDCSLSSINKVIAEELRRIIIGSPPKSCELDPLPTFLLPEHVDLLLPILKELYNRSIREGVLPSSQKRSVLILTLKSDGLDQENPTNYRPIANVLFLSKIIEKIVAYQLTCHLERNNLLPSCQKVAPLRIQKVPFDRNSSASPLIRHLRGY